MVAGNRDTVQRNLDERSRKVSPLWMHQANQRFPPRGRVIMNLLRLWSDLDMWQRYGLAVIGAAVILAFVAWLML